MDPIRDRNALASALRLIEREAEAYLDGVDAALVRPPGQPMIEGDLPSEGVGSLVALAELVAAGDPFHGPRFFHFVMGVLEANAATA